MNIIGKRKIFFIISSILIVLSIVSLSVWGLNLGLDFKGGTLMELKFNKSIDTENVKNSISDLDFTKGVSIQKTGNNQILIKTLNLNKDQEQKLKSQLNEKVGEFQEIRLESVGPTVSKNLTKKAIIAVLIACIMIIFYIAYAFRSIPKPANSWRFGIAAILALVHDLLIVAGIFSILGHFFGYEVDSLFITAMLTILGYSNMDTIVIFDRIRENLRKYPSRSFVENTNNSINQTITRSLNTSLITLILLTSILIIGGGSIKHFIVALIIGIILGTYSSIFIASAFLVEWQNFLTKKHKA